MLPGRLGWARCLPSCCPQELEQLLREGAEERARLHRKVEQAKAETVAAEEKVRLRHF